MNLQATSVTAWKLHRSAIAAHLVHLREIDCAAFWEFCNTICQLRTFWRPATTIQAAPQEAPWLSAGAHLESNGVDIRSLSPGGGTAFGRSQSRGSRDCYWSAAQLGSKMNAFVFQVICVCAVRRFLLLADFVAKGIAAKPARARCGA